LTAWFEDIRTAYAVSAIGHAAVLLWSVWSLAANPLPVSSTEGLPVDLISADDFSKIAAGMKDAPKAETPKPLVEKVAEANPVDDPTAKVVEKKEVKAAREPPPAAESKPAESKPEQKQAETKPDPIADALAKDEAKKPEQKKAEVKPPLPPKKPAPPVHKFDPKQVAALLDKRDSTRLAAAGEALNDSPSLGLSNGTAAQLSLSELEGLRARLAQLWAIPAGAKDPQELVVQVRIKLRPDGTLAGPPMVLTSGKSPLFVAARDSAIRALFRGQPFDMLRPEHYEQWKDIEITFDPRDMIRG
jgi:outer membrane biosynthesis protein TonB